METKKRPPRTEYLSMATIVIVIAVVMVIIMIATSPKSSREGVSSEEPSVPEISVEESSEEESSVPEQQTVYAEVKSVSRLNGLVAITRANSSGNTPSDLVSVYSQKNDTFGLSGSALKLSGQAMDAFNDFTQAFFDVKGKNNLVMHKGYTPASELTADDAERQADLTTGNAVWLTLYPADPDGDTLGSGKFTWLADNCNTYGYILRYPDEKTAYTGQTGTKSLYRFVGYTHAAYMGKYHYSLEEYLTTIKSNASYENPVLFDAGGKTGDRSCMLYYVAASDAETTQIPIPEGKTDYEISGNGSDGFIVIVY